MFYLLLELPPKCVLINLPIAYVGDKYMSHATACFIILKKNYKFVDFIFPQLLLNSEEGHEML